jgi:hypothetical protein
MLETSNDRYGCGDDALVASARARRANAAHEAMSDATTRARARGRGPARDIVETTDAK